MNLLPPEVGTPAHAIGFYQKYSVFSWPWSLRRTLVFAPVMVMSATLFGLSHVAAVHDWWDGASVAWRQLVSGFVLICAGPLAAAALRAARWPRRAERIAVVAAILVGIVLFALVDHWADAYHDTRMAAHGRAHASMSVIPGVGQGALSAANDALGLVMWMFLGGFFALFAYFGEERRWREYHARAELQRLRAQKHAADQELAVLQAQVEPHFLFNTLASLRSLVHSEPARASRTIDALVDYLRATLPKLRADGGGVAPTTLAEQFALCESYLALMRVRMGDRLRVNVELPDALRDVAFPPLILLSLVENAIKHGIEPKPGPVHVAVRAAREGGLVLVGVEDDGVGLALGMGGGTGLTNIRAHLLNRYGDRASLRLEQRAGGGAVASIRIPCASPA